MLSGENTLAGRIKSAALMSAFRKVDTDYAVDRLLMTIGDDGMELLANRAGYIKRRVCHLIPAQGGGAYCSSCHVWIRSDSMADATKYIIPRYCPNCGAQVLPPPVKLQENS